MLSCVVNVSEGTVGPRIDAIAASAGGSLLDRHSDPVHNRSVLTLGGTQSSEVERAAMAVAATAIDQLDIAFHEGVHPRIGVVDVVPFVPFVAGGSLAELEAACLVEAVEARDRFASQAGRYLGLPCFLYGPLPGGTSRTLPELRRHAFVDMAPDAGPSEPHPSAGGTCVGGRRCLVAYNLVLEGDDLELGRSIARRLRSDDVRALAFVVGDGVQVSCNLVAPWRTGPLAVFDAVSAWSAVRSAELVGLVPVAVAEAVPVGRREEVGITLEATLEARLGLL